MVVAVFTTTLMFLLAWTAVLTAAATQRQELLDTMGQTDDRRSGGATINNVRIAHASHCCLFPLRMFCGFAMPTVESLSSQATHHNNCLRWCYTDQSGAAEKRKVVFI